MKQLTHRPLWDILTRAAATDLIFLTREFRRARLNANAAANAELYRGHDQRPVDGLDFARVQGLGLIAGVAIAGAEDRVADNPHHAVGRDVDQHGLRW